MPSLVSAALGAPRLATPLHFKHFRGGGGGRCGSTRPARLSGARGRVARPGGSASRSTARLREFLEDPVRVSSAVQLYGLLQVTQNKRGNT